ncbi:MAG TPA: amino acid racemase [Bacillota bacterium]|nr:amino acid racemase [Bacillota bacterium]HOR86434.1 amino acid racemase [Bacillota bacterium]HPL53055.1 amino acid racemase [Bacillota bacterium]
MKKSIGILGGMGPMATADLFKKIVDYTAASKDSEHIHVYIDSNTDIPDRTEAILRGGKDPVPEMVGSAIRLECMGADFLLIPCNTAHYFYDKICAMVHIPVLNMLEETALEVKRQNINCVGLLATDGTIESGVYDRVFEKYGISVLHPSSAGQKNVMDLIYKGVKAGEKDIDLAGFNNVLEELKRKGAETIILGCTELPIAFETYNIQCKNIDPTAVLARSAIVYANGKLRNYSNPF